MLGIDGFCNCQQIMIPVLGDGSLCSCVVFIRQLPCYQPALKAIVSLLLVRGILLDLFSLVHFIFLLPLVSQGTSAVDFPLRTVHLEDQSS